MNDTRRTGNTKAMRATKASATKPSVTKPKPSDARPGDAKPRPSETRPPLRRGDEGPVVRELQERLRDAGFPPGPIDGQFGGGTEAAVLAFQTSFGLVADGEVGPRSWAALLAAPEERAEVAAGAGEIAVADVTGKVTAEMVSAMLPGAALGNIGKFLPPILAALREFNLADRNMVLMAIATIAAETAGCVPCDEGISRFNTSPGGEPFDLYDFRRNLGNSARGHGAAYKGRGFVQLTGRDNYERIGRKLGVDLLAAPERANEPELAARVLAAFLKSREGAIKAALLEGDLRQARKLVNGGQHGFERFEPAWRTGERLLGTA